MTKELRCACFDPSLRVEAVAFTGIAQNFPNHFHEHYVIGFVESGRRRVLCQNTEYALEPGDLVIFNPRDSHICEQIGTQPLAYRCINIAPDVMEQATRDITGQASLPRFSPTVISRSDLAPLLRDLHRAIMREENGLRKEELFLLLIEQLVAENGQAPAQYIEPEEKDTINAICAYLEENSGRCVTLDELATMANWSKYHLLRCFARKMGITPYRYLETIRIERSKRLLEAGATPLSAAMQTGFSDQSHFSNSFKEIIGLTPRQYRRIFENQESSTEDTNGNRKEMRAGD